MSNYFYTLEQVLEICKRLEKNHRETDLLLILASSADFYAIEGCELDKEWLDEMKKCNEYSAQIQHFNRWSKNNIYLYDGTSIYGSDATFQKTTVRKIIKTLFEWNKTINLNIVSELEKYYGQGEYPELSDFLLLEQI